MEIGYTNFGVSYTEFTTSNGDIKAIKKDSIEEVAD